MQDSFTAEGGSSNSPWGAGVLLGAQIGCNYQLGRFVVGLESEAWGAFLKTQNNLAFERLRRARQRPQIHGILPPLPGPVSLSISS